MQGDMYDPNDDVPPRSVTYVLLILNISYALDATI
jgi:hypothetical protein